MTGEGFVQTFVLGSLPDGTPGAAAFALVTAQDGWDAGRTDLRFALEDDRFVLRRAYPAGTLLSFKVTRGSAQSEEGDAWGQRRPDRRHEVTGDAVHVLDVQSWMDGPSVPRPSSVTGVTWTHALHSPELGDALTVTVWVPPGYSGSTARFPVLYLHDGQNVLDRRTAFAGEEWGVRRGSARAGPGGPAVPAGGRHGARRAPRGGLRAVRDGGERLHEQRGRVPGISGRHPEVLRGRHVPDGTGRGAHGAGGQQFRGARVPVRGAVTAGRVGHGRRVQPEPVGAGSPTAHREAETAKAHRG